MTQHYEAISYEDVPELAHYSTAFLNGRRKILDGLGQVNLLVGPNNAGKSRFMRALFKQGAFKHRPSDFPLTAIRIAIDRLRAVIGDQMPRGVIGYGNVKRDMIGPHVIDGDLLPSDGDFLAKARSMVKSIIDNRSFVPQWEGSRSQPHEHELRHFHERLASEAQKCFDALEAARVGVGGEARIYIPILRGLRELASGTNPYLERTQRDYELPLGDNASAFTGLGLYERLKELLLGDREHRALVQEFEDFLSAEYFDGADIQLVPKSKSDVVHVVIGNEVEKPIYELGDGIQSIVTITFPMFTAEKRTLFFVEEPEVHLHPGMQRRLVESFRSERFRHHQVFLTTHSNHLLDVAADYESCSTYLFRPDGGLTAFRIHHMEGKDKRVLRSLGARSSSMYLANAIVWVEGMTDRLYLRELLRRYLKEHPSPRPIKEDTHYVLAEVGGASVVHWNFDGSPADLGTRIKAACICADNFLVLDGDNAGKGTRVEEFDRQLAKRFHLLRVKEIENLLPVEAVVAGVRAVAPPHFPQGWAVPVSASYQTDGGGLGTYLDKTVPGYSFGTPSGTIRDKVKFCYAAVEEMRRSSSWALSQEANDLCGKLVSFILEANPSGRAPSA